MRLRKLLLWLLSIILLGMVAFGGTIAYFFVTAKVDTVGKVDFDRPLAVPPLARSSLDARGRRVFDLTMQEGSTDLGRDGKTPTWGMNGSYLAPTLRASRGETVVARVTNELGEASTVHWHGMHLPARMDGGPHQMIDPGDTWSPTWQVRQPAATLWYHPHPHGKTAEHVYRGLAGMFIVDDPAEAAVQKRLPSSYGVDDVPVIVQDKRFDGWKLDESKSLFSSTGVLGDTLLVNGTPGPYLDVTTQRIRMRLLNGSNARIYNFHFDDDRRFQQVAGDGGLLPAPVGRAHLELSPGERAEIVVTVKPGDRTVLQSAPLTSVNNRFGGADDRFDVMELRAADDLAPSPQVPSRLAPAPDLTAEDVVKTRDLELTGTRINGDKMEMSRIDQTVTVDTTERWRVKNDSGSAHNFHVHDVQFVIESLDGKPPPAHLAGWKDTVFLRPHREVDLLVRFTDYADPDTPYMYHCHLLFHEDSGMMGQFVVVKPGEQAGRVKDAEHEHHH